MNSLFIKYLFFGALQYIAVALAFYATTVHFLDWSLPIWWSLITFSAIALFITANFYRKRFQALRYNRKHLLTDHPAYSVFFLSRWLALIGIIIGVFFSLSFIYSLGELALSLIQGSERAPLSLGVCVFGIFSALFSSIVHGWANDELCFDFKTAKSVSLFGKLKR